MKRGDMPANSLNGDAYNDLSSHINDPGIYGIWPECFGMTIRERVAMSIIQGIVSNPTFDPEKILNAIKASFEGADAWLAENEKRNKND